MKEMLAQPAGPVCLSLPRFWSRLLILCRASPGAIISFPASSPSPVPTALDAAALTAALSEAQAAGQQRRLPGLYLSLARCRLDEGKTAAAEELLRKCILAAAGAGLEEAHARARLALGDIAQPGATGDRLRALADRARHLPAEAGKRPPCRRGAHAAQWLPDGLGAYGFLGGNAAEGR
jgi:hypothetical protein